MDRDPELDVTLSDGRRVVTFQIAAVTGGREAWLIVEPGALRRVIRGDAAALATRQRVDTRIAARLAAGWVPVDRRPADAPSVAPTPLPPDLVLQISSLLEGLTRARPALRAADPSGQLWAACHVFRQQAWRFGVGAPHARVLRARQERRLGELAEQAGDRAAAIFYYRAALASYTRVGVARRLMRLEVHEPRREAGMPRVRPRIACTRAFHDSTRLVPRTERSCVSGHSARPHTWRHEMKGRIQIVGRLPVELNRRVRATAKKRKVSLNAFVIDALTQALGPRRVAAMKEPR
jgi:HicB family